MKTFLENIFITLHTGYTPKFHLSNVFLCKRGCYFYTWW